MLGLPAVCYALVYICNAEGQPCMATSLPLKLPSCLPIVPEGLIPTLLSSKAMYHPQTSSWKTYSTWHIDSIACVAVIHLACCAGCDALRGPAAWPGFAKGTPIVTWEACAVLSGWLAWQVCPPFHPALVRFLGATSVTLEPQRIQSAQSPSRAAPPQAPNMLLA